MPIMSRLASANEDPERSLTERVPSDHARHFDSFHVLPQPPPQERGDRYRQEGRDDDAHNVLGVDPGSLMHPGPVDDRQDAETGEQTRHKDRRGDQRRRDRCPNNRRRPHRLASRAGAVDRPEGADEGHRRHASEECPKGRMEAEHDHATACDRDHDHEPAHCEAHSGESHESVPQARADCSRTP